MEKKTIQCYRCGKDTTSPKFCNRKCFLFYLHNIPRNKSWRDNASKHTKSLWEKGIFTQEVISKRVEASAKTRKQRGPYTSWNRNLTKETDERVKAYGEKQRGKYVSNETRERQRAIRKGKTWEEIFGVEKANELRLSIVPKLISVAKKFEKGHKDTQETKDRKRQGRIKYMRETGVSTVSKDEHVIRRLLDKLGIYYIPQNWIQLSKVRWAEVDIYIPSWNLCIFCDGDYWHAFPGKYADDTIIKNGKTAKEIQESDAWATNKLEEMGYNVLRLWGHEIVDTPEKCLEKILNHK